jgi:hypothetical protein
MSHAYQLRRLKQTLGFIVHVDIKPLMNNSENRVKRTTDFLGHELHQTVFSALN